jgi:hypothetical protein
MENSIKWTEEPVHTNLVAKIGAWTMMLLLAGMTFVIPAAFMFVFTHHIFMMGYYICENVMVAVQRIDLWAKVFNREYLEDGKGVVLFFDFVRPIARKTADQLVELNREMKSPKPEEADEVEEAKEAKTEAPKEAKPRSERKYF